ncbi:Tripartite tricarboxylate transporter TctB family protein [bacterium YEK0313]|nr:Tripartite tricarboxylate transporter TctB family protein [bacterium YEK0313]
MEEGRRAGPDRAVIAIGIGLIAVAAVVLWQSWELRASFGNQAIGPQMAPFAVCILLAVLGGLTIREGLRGEAPARDDDDWGAVLWIGGGLAAMIGLIKTAGFVPGAAVLFAATARAFGSARALVDLLVGAALALVVYLGFVRLLGLTLPSGFVETLF